MKDFLERALAWALVFAVFFAFWWVILCMIFGCEVIL